MALIFSSGIEEVSHNYKQWFHFASGLSIEKMGGVYRADVDGNTLNVQSLSLGTDASEVIVGQTEPLFAGMAFSQRRSA